jgi:tryptophan synthase beta subunit
VNVSGRGDKDINTVAEIDGIKFWIDLQKDFLI